MERRTGRDMLPCVEYHRRSNGYRNTDNYHQDNRLLCSVGLISRHVVTMKKVVRNRTLFCEKCKTKVHLRIQPMSRNNLRLFYVGEKKIILILLSIVNTTQRFARNTTMPLGKQLHGDPIEVQKVGDRNIQRNRL